MDLTQISVLDLLRLHSSVLDELRTRGIITTANAPLGDYAEWLFRKAFGWQSTGNSARDFDATDAQDNRYQIKARRLHPRNKSRQLGALRRLDQKNFEILATVLFDTNYNVLRAALIPHSVAYEHARYIQSTNAWRFMLYDRVWDYPGVVDCTLDLKRAQSQM